MDDNMPAWLSVIVSWTPMLIYLGMTVFFGMQLVGIRKVLERMAHSMERKDDEKL